MPGFLIGGENSLGAQSIGWKAVVISAIPVSSLVGAMFFLSQRIPD
jgi:hypothetical protein